MQLLVSSFLFSILISCVTSYRNNMMITMMMNKNISNKKSPSSSSLSLSSKRFQQPWLNKAIIGVFVAFQVIIPTVTFNPSTSLADAIPLVGTKAPDFSLPSNAGKRTVLYFYPGDFTQGCTIEAQGFERDIEKYKSLGVQIVGVSVDSVDKHLDFGKKYGLDFPLLSDQGGEVSNKYGSLLNLGFLGKFSNRQTYIISPDSNIEYVFTDVEGKVVTHSEDVLKKLAAL